MSGYSQGVRVEHADVIAVGAGHLLLVNVKRTTPPGPGERAQLVTVAARIPGIALPLVAMRPARQPLTYRLLTGTGPHDWTPWTPGDDT